MGQQQLGLKAGAQLFGTDQQQSVLAALGEEQLTDCTYSPYGHRPAEGGLFSLAGFNGEQLDPVTGLYLLGNGYRAYSPTLMRFLAPDNMSPFGEGGLNAYAYCLGDPVNRVDPTGHISWQSILGIGLSVLGIVASVLTMGAATPWAAAALGLAVASGLAGIASELVNHYAPDSSAGEALGWISAGLGLASLGTGLAAGAKAAVNAGRKLASAFQSGLSSRGAGKAAKAFAKGKGAKAAAKAQSAKATARVEDEVEQKWTVVRPKDKMNFLNIEARNASETRVKLFIQLIEEGNSPTSAAALLHAEYTPLKGPSSSSSRLMHLYLSKGDRVYLTENAKDRIVIIKQMGGHYKEKK
ncbi:RHS repeat-associated core domain-containing protein [Pseudomonas sp. RL_35y_Pfl2_P42]|uniref:RHS repeat-associated core domain-containing protein n=1 Tax=Pseudomonas sp. RL_35y_Pfl2_P42 TaxID=3088710 RepID=UPI0030DB6E38